VILFLTYAFAALIIGLYVAWFVHRYRREQRDKAMKSEPLLPSTTGLLTRDPILSSPAPPPPPPSPGPGDVPAAPSPTFSPGGTGARTVAEALSGVSMPHDLVPLTIIPPRPGVRDQVAFSSRAPVAVIAPLFADELERLGYTLTTLEETAIAARRGDDILMVYIHLEPPPGAPEGIVAIEVCVPY
jgi:hypothetical protein